MFRKWKWSMRLPCLRIAFILISLICLTSLVCLQYLRVGVLSDPNSRVNLKDRDFSIPIKTQFNPQSFHENGLIFFKTHKTAGSTLSRILSRILCESAEKYCFVPFADHPGRTWDLSIKEEFDRIKHSSKRANQTFDVWVHHLKASHRGRIRELIPTAHATVSIIRRPAHRFRSAWYWYSSGQMLDMSLSQFVGAMQRWGLFVPRAWLSAVGNLYYQFPYRTGLDSTFQELAGITHNSEFLQDQQSVFDEIVAQVLDGRLFLLVADRFDESLLVLADLLGLPLHRVMYFRQKVNNPPEPVSEEALSALDSMQPFDLALFSLASAVLDQLTNGYSGGPVALRRDLLAFNASISAAQDFCRIKCSARSANNSMSQRNEDIEEPEGEGEGEGEGEIEPKIDEENKVTISPTRSSYCRHPLNSASAVDLIHACLNSSQYTPADERNAEHLNRFGAMIDQYTCWSLMSDSRAAVLQHWRNLRTIANYNKGHNTSVDPDTVFRCLFSNSGDLLSTWLSK